MINMKIKKMYLYAVVVFVLLAFLILILYLKPFNKKPQQRNETDAIIWFVDKD